MLNLELIDDLYASLPKERQKELITKLFNKSKQSMGYFHRTKELLSRNLRCWPISSVCRSITSDRATASRLKTYSRMLTGILR